MASITLTINAADGIELADIIEQLAGRSSETLAESADGSNFPEQPAPQVEKPRNKGGRPRKDAQPAAQNAPGAAVPASDAGTETGTATTGNATTTVDPFEDGEERGPPPKQGPIEAPKTKDDVKGVMIELMNKGVEANQLNEILMKAVGVPNIAGIPADKFSDAYHALQDSLLSLG